LSVYSGQRRSFRPEFGSTHAGDDGEVSKIPQHHQEEPEVLEHVVSTIKSRMIHNQDLKTAQHRLELMASVI
jgi:hypothetical protein